MTVDAFEVRNWQRAYLAEGTEGAVEVPLTAGLWWPQEGRDCAALVTAHRECGRLDLRRAAEVMRGPVLVDGRAAADPAACRQAGRDYRAVGKP